VSIKEVGLTGDTTFHDLRHTFASTALAQGVPISEVSRWLGHKSITTTVDLYGHLVPEAADRARDAIDKAFDRHSRSARSGPRSNSREMLDRPRCAPDVHRERVAGSRTPA
jgi:hypothetical protein